MVHFWCILGARFNVTTRRVKVKTESKSSFVCPLVSYLTLQTIIHDTIYTNTYIKAVRHTHSLHYAHSRHTHICYRLLSRILFQQIKLHFTKVTFC